MLENAISNLIENNIKMIELGEKAKKEQNQLSWTNIIKDYNKLIFEAKHNVYPFYCNFSNKKQWLNSIKKIPKK